MNNNFFCHCEEFPTIVGSEEAIRLLRSPVNLKPAVHTDGLGCEVNGLLRHSAYGVIPRNDVDNKK